MAQVPSISVFGVGNSGAHADPHHQYRSCQRAIGRAAAQLVAETCTLPLRKTAMPAVADYEAEKSAGWRHGAIKVLRR